MPSLKALEEFRTSFRTLGNEVAIKDQQNLLMEDLELPDAQPAHKVAKQAASGDITTAPNATESSYNMDDFGFDELVNIGDDLPVPSSDDSFGLPADASEPDMPPDTAFPAVDVPSAPASDEESQDALSLDDLPGFNTERPAGPPEAGDTPPAASPLVDLSLDDLPNFPSEPTDEEAAVISPEVPPGVGPIAAAPQEEKQPDTGEAPVPKPQDTPASIGTLQDGLNIEPLSLNLDDVTSLDLNSIDLDDSGYKSAADESDPFGMSDLDALLADSGKASNQVEEILLSEEDFTEIQKTLDSYPLNLRIACEELIVEQAVLPDMMSQLIKSLIKGAPARETAILAGKILERHITIPQGFEKRTGEALEASQKTFAYFFIHKILPMARLFLMIALVAGSLFYLGYRFIYTPLHAESIYKTGYEHIGAGEYARANERFQEAFALHRVKQWFYRYADAFRDVRQYRDAEKKYDDLLRYYPRDKKGALDYANMETNYLHNYKKADDLLRRNILDYRIDDREGLLAVGDNAIAWGDDLLEKGNNALPQYEAAREAYARLLERYGWTDPIMERMMQYFIRTDNLKEVLGIQAYFAESPKRKISASSLADLGGYLLDKKFEEVRGVPNEYISAIDGVRDILLKAAKADPSIPESHYHLARYYNYFGNTDDERTTLERAIAAFDTIPGESISRLKTRIDAERRYAHILINKREFFAAEEQLLKGVAVYEDALGRGRLSRSPAFGQLYADLGDLEYFTKDGNLKLALEHYLRSEQHGWAPPEMQYRMGAAHYQQQQWKDAQERLVAASGDLPLNRRILNALGNVSYMRGDYFIAQGYFRRLLDMLEKDRSRFSLLLPDERGDHQDLVERLMVSWNNMGVTLEALTDRSGDNQYRAYALGFYAESARAWDTLTRDRASMVRFGAGDLALPGISRAFLNSRNALHPESGYEPQLYLQIDKDVLEPSPWEELTPQNFRRLSDDVF
ncbi:MAG: tetratricopeptide repeat protein [Treponema sp.]|jgi:tetratricopeptide (TPR) repeat protein|nr:tetratricopeptide repeat protein [Treponema sp.]